MAPGTAGGGMTAGRQSGFPHYLSSGQRRCYDQAGRPIPCTGSGQDAEFAPGLAWHRPRFARQGRVVRDRLTGLCWSQSANLAQFPLTWQEALDFVAEMNRRQACGQVDWRLPNRRELRSLISHHTRDPALPQGHPFQDVFRGWYWTSTSAARNPAFAWYVHSEGGRMFYGNKQQAYLVWPCRSQGNGALAATGQGNCFDSQGRVVECAGSGQDGELQLGVPWPQPRFAVQGEVVADRLTGLRWTRNADLAPGPLTWQQALLLAADMRPRRLAGVARWRLPTINELESLVDSSEHDPALPAGHPFLNPQEAYWSATSSAFEPDWAMALYLDKGAVGVGQKQGAHFSVWAVARERNSRPS